MTGVLGAGLAGLGALNVAAFAGFGIDKARAKARKRRVGERTLLLLALIGGTPGAYAGRRIFRHKTRKQPFVAWLHTITALQLAIGAAGLFMLAR